MIIIQCHKLLFNVCSKFSLKKKVSSKISLKEEKKKHSFKKLWSYNVTSYYTLYPRKSNLYYTMSQVTFWLLYCKKEKENWLKVIHIYEKVT
jgi:hypothetical protein